ncbi:MAG: class I SAM-dependent methyltransferase [Oligoflexia bacterium]|nr:class I SAM-dependent methyltransferase [Oligoflexia bacterium]
MRIENQQAYEEYYNNPREDVLRHLEGKFTRSLDIGCAAGMVSKHLVEKKIVKEADGLELEESAYQVARSQLRRVEKIDLCVQDFPVGMDQYDLVLCLDVLEHMVDPWLALRKIKKVMNPDGLLLVSLPNVANHRVVRGLLKGDWKYEDSGILDRTHLRFFTKKTGAALLEEAGFRLERVLSTNMAPYSKSWWLNALTLSLFKNQLIIQNLYFARPEKSV